MYSASGAGRRGQFGTPEEGNREARYQRKLGGLSGEFGQFCFDWKGCNVNISRFRATVCCASLIVALAPLAAFADTSPSHAQDEVTNGQAQLVEAEQQVSDMQAEAQQSAANERMIGLLRSEAMRQMQLNNVANGNALEQIAAALANAARANGELNARNELAIAQMRAAALIATADANLANGQQLALTRGRNDELANARAQSALLHQVADFITSTQAELNMSSARQTGQDEADAIHTPGIAEQQNSQAMAADELLDADTALNAGALAATSATLSANVEESAVLAHAEASLANAETMLAEAETH